MQSCGAHNEYAEGFRDGEGALKETQNVVSELLTGITETAKNGGLPSPALYEAVRKANALSRQDEDTGGV